MIGAKITPEQMERYRELQRRANDPAEIAKRKAQFEADAAENYQRIGEALLAMTKHDGRCASANGRVEESGS